MQANWTKCAQKRRTRPGGTRTPYHRGKLLTTYTNPNQNMAHVTYRLEITQIGYKGVHTSSSALLFRNNLQIARILSRINRQAGSTPSSVGKLTHNNAKLPALLIHDKERSAGPT